MGEVPPADALADERDLRRRLDRHLRLDRLDDADDARARELRERRSPIAEDPRITVLIGADRPGEAELGEGSGEDVLCARVARVLEVVIDAIERRARLGMLELEPRDDECTRAVPAEDERDRPLGRDEREPGVVEDVVRVEEHDSRELRTARVLEERVAPRAMLVRPDRDRADHQIESLVPWTREGRPTASRITFSV